ncbi:MAG: hypothetical protein SAJ37_09910 [Oscillatoria sp. PMC 1068.18]|nr:hypothetical protein [Oscillatoria sp. PMC 1076.18]MEC4989051.1 hypothetical protein [Oscillatoria sp. PMC 1068.18]
MKSSQSNERNALTVDGIRFETLVPKWRIAIPKQEDIQKPVQFGLKITNQSSLPYRFSFFGLMPELRDENEQLLFRVGNTNRVKIPQESDYFLALPGKSFTHFPEVKLSWNQYKLQFWGRGSFDGFWNFRHLQRGKYEARFLYKNEKSIQKLRHGGTVEGIWVGEVSTPWVEFRLVK